MLKIRELIKKVRACKTAEEERSVINKESAEIRNASKDSNNPHKARDLAKAIYMQMMGYQTSFMQMSCINLLASKNFTEKRMAYSALSLVMDDTSEVLLLATATIKKDLKSDNLDSVALALNSIGDVCTPDMCRELSFEVAGLIKSSKDPNIKKRCACAATHIIKKCPELIETFIDKIPNLLEDRTHSVCMTGIIFVLEILKIDPSYSIKVKKYHEMFVKYEKSLLSVSYSPEFDVNGITDPFLQAKIIEIMKYIAKDSEKLSADLGDLFVSVQSITEASKQTGYAIQYEIVKTINDIKANPGMKSLSNTILGKFLASKDLNLKYIALKTLKDVARYDIGAVQKHRALILEFLKDSDVSLQRRALDLIYLIINESNLKQITKECLNFLPTAEKELKLDVTTRLTQAIDQYAPNFKWEIDTLIKMVVLAGNSIYEDTLSKIINMIIQVKELSVYSVHKLFITLENNVKNTSLVKLSLYVIGENCDILLANSVLGANGEEITVNFNQLTALLKKVASENRNDSTVIEYLLNCVMKVGNRVQKVEGIIEDFQNSPFYEVQQRAVEYKVFDKVNQDLRKKACEKVPLPKEGNAKEKNILGEEEEETDSPVIKLKSTSINQINNTQKSTPPDAKGETTQAEQNNNATFEANSTAINLLDLENIFSSSAQTQNAQPSMPSIPFQQGAQPQQNQINDLFNMMQGLPQQSSQPQPQSQPQQETTQPPAEIPSAVQQESNAQPEMKECFKNSDISLYYVISKVDNQNYNGTIFATNNSSEKLNNVKINFMVLKFVTLKVLSTSGNTIEPKQSFGIKKEFTLTSNDPSKKIVMKIKLVYQSSAGETTQMITIDDFK